VDLRERRIWPAAEDYRAVTEGVPDLMLFRTASLLKFFRGFFWRFEAPLSRVSASMSAAR
jgi:hypothetical protein